MNDAMTLPIQSSRLQKERFSCDGTCGITLKVNGQDFCTNKVSDNAGNIENGNEIVKEDHVLVLPQKLTKHALSILFSRRAMPMPWNLEGRFGSRTFRVDDFHMGIPVLDKVILSDVAVQFPDLHELLNLPQVTLRYQSFVDPPKHRTRELPYIDATHHPERAPLEFDLAMAMEKANGVLDFKPQAPLFTYAELFAGLGGFGVALDALGGRCVLASDIEEHLQDIYRHNFVTVPNRQRTTSDPIDVPIHGDIYGISDDALPKSLDLLVGGFPCQPFSALGEQPGFHCPKSGNLFLEIVRVLNISRPKAFLLENVPGLLAMTETYNTIVKSFEEAGYDVTTEVVAARGLTATGRKRLFFVGLQRDTAPTEKSVVALGNSRREYKFPFIPDLQLKARDVIDYDELPTSEMEILRLQDATFKQLLDCGRWRTHSLAWPNKILDTLTSHYGEHAAMLR
jgi:DNA-cytosine methyltransferase